jgi:hypothetical protein
VSRNAENGCEEGDAATWRDYQISVHRGRISWDELCAEDPSHNARSG